MGVILLILLIMLLMGSLPVHGYSKSWGYGPTGLLGLILLIVVVLALVGSIPWGFARRPVYVVQPQRPVIIDRRPITVVNPPATPAKQADPPQVPNP